MKNFILTFSLMFIFFATSATESEARRLYRRVANRDGAQKPRQLEQVDLNKIKKNYWARGDETELGVVQNRAYSKKGRLELTPIAGIIYSDPFLDTKIFGAMFSYHFSEYFAISMLGWRSIATGSSALTFLEANLQGTANTNIPRWYAGVEAGYSLFYGKLSVLGKSIIYYDLIALGGVGLTDTESGRYITPHLGIGQRFFLSQTLSLKVDYRLQFYREQIREKNIPTIRGTVTGERSNWSNTITLGVGIMF